MNEHLTEVELVANRLGRERGPRVPTYRPVRRRRRKTQMGVRWNRW